MVVGVLLLMLSVVFAQEVIPKYGQEIPPRGDMEQGTLPQEEITIEEKITYEDISPKELEKVLKEMDEKDIIRLLQKGLKYGGEKRLFLSGSNYFYYHPALPVLFVFIGKEIDQVALFSSGAKALFKDNALVIFPPQREEGKFFGFVVFFKDGRAVNFIGERVNPLREKKTSVTTYYEYVEKKNVPVEKVIEAFIRKYKRCPKDKELVVVEGAHYIFEKTEGNIATESDHFFACGVVYRVRRF